MPVDLNPLEVFSMYANVPSDIPDIIEFTMSDKYLNRPNLYPRQGTLLKIIFLQEFLLTEYDYEVIAEWEQAYLATADDKGEGNNGIVPGVLERMRINSTCPCGHHISEHIDRAGRCTAGLCICSQYTGRRWFREVVSVIGRRGSKGHLGAIAGAYVLWHYICKGDPQDYYGIDRDKQLTGIVFAGKKDQAKVNQWRDLSNVILGAPCYSRYISRAQTESLTLYSRYDFIKMAERLDRGIDTDVDQATFLIVPKESTTLAGRGPASFLQCLDPETPVLKADLTWVPIKSLKPGDEVIGIDEKGDHGKKRKLRRATVEAVWHTHKPALRLTFEDGSSVVCSPEHKWLSAVEGGGGNYLWRTAKKIKPGHRIRRLVDPWEPDESRGAGYLAGFFDGEGCIVSTERRRRGSDVLWSQNFGPVLDQVNGLLRERGFTPRLNRDPALSTCQQWALRGMAEVLRFLGQIKPTRLHSKAHHVWEGIVPSDGRLETDRFKIVASVEEMPEQDLVDITTSTRTFIANGLVSHNCYDEAAHIVKGVAKSPAEEVYEAASPSLDQFGLDGFIYLPSSPWQKIGLFYDKYQDAIARDEDGTASYPEMLMVQLTSWDPYEDWERAHEIPRAPGELPYQRLKNAIQTYDHQMQQLERANPDTFAVERRSRFAAVLDAYLNPAKVAAIWEPYNGQTLTMGGRGNLATAYRAHGDPSKSGAGFGFSIAHIAGIDERGLPHVVFDEITAWLPENYEGHEVDYDEIQKDLADYLDRYMPYEMTFDQFGSVSLIQSLQRHAQKMRYPKQVQIYERTATGPLNWKTYETFKTALGLGLVHAPYFELANQELTFLQDLGGKVEHPTTGPVRTKDVADTMSILVYELIGDQIGAFIGKMLSDTPLGATAQGGMDPYAGAREEAHQSLSAFGRGRSGAGMSAARRRR